jgi:hypothetical protein
VKEIRYFGNSLDGLMKGSIFTAELKARGIDYNLAFEADFNQFSVTWEEPFLNLENK